MMLVNVIVTKAHHGMSSYEFCIGRCKGERKLLQCDTYTY